MNTIQQYWETYKEAVLPKDASETQIEETKRGFYAGGWSVLTIMTRVIADQNISEEAGIQMLQGLLDECEYFKNGVLNKK